MPGKKKNRKKQPQGAKWRQLFTLPRRLIAGLKAITGIALVGVVSCGFIFVHDFLTQSDYFNARNLKIQGFSRLTERQIANQAQVNQGINILAVNLSAVRTKLLNHPWIAEAEIRREIPAGLSIKIEEHRPVAILDLGPKFLINTKGEIFKEWEKTDPSNLPIINGLELSDVKVHSHSIRTDGDVFGGNFRAADGSPVSSVPFDAVMNVLHLGQTSDTILPNRRIKKIQVDREIGLTLYAAFNRIKIINLGFDDYADKYHVLANLLAYIKNHHSISDFDRIDLNNVNRVVVNPIKFESIAGDS